MSEFVVFNPTAVITRQSQQLADRLDTLAGKKIGLLFNSKPNADVLLRRVQERISERFGDTEFVFRMKPGAAKGMAPEVVEAMSDCDAVVNAFGD